MAREIVVNFGSNAWYRMCSSICLYAGLDSQPTFLRNDKFCPSETSVSITKLTLINLFLCCTVISFYELQQQFFRFCHGIDSPILTRG